MIPLVSDTHILFQMPPKKKFKDTRSSSEVFLLGQPSPTPVTMTKPLTNGDMVRYMHYMKSLECNKSASWEMLSSCPQIKGTAEANCGSVWCFLCQFNWWLDNNWSSSKVRQFKYHVMNISKDWQYMNKMSYRLSKPELTTKRWTCLRPSRIR